ncbi:MAG TPA: HEAT repeat domain-containing protein [Candidatus Limnocylindrales bacterium]|nr:HEAT repeat domain-containing protein [Candidatus Limnocylindrales bacterium]
MMGLDLPNLGLGLLAGWGSAYLVFRSRHGIQRVIGVARGGAASAGTAATQSADRRYINDLLARIDASSMLGPQVPLRSLLIEPRFIPMRPLDAEYAEDSGHDLYASIPLIHEFPYLYAPYHLETLTLDELSGGSTALALLGLPGSGRTTALLAAALHALGRLNFEQAPDVVQARLDREEAALSEKERAVRVKERVLTEQRAKERLASERAELAPQDAAPTDQEPTERRFDQLVPVYVHLAEVLAEAADFTGGVDPAEPLVRAVQASVGRVTASILPRELYRWLTRGLVLALVDGYDELTEADKARARSWLTAFRAQYSRNFVVVAGGVTGSGPLLDLGLTPVFLRPWTDLDVASAVTKASAAARPVDRKGKAGPLPDAAALERAAANARALSAAEITLKIAANLGGAVESPGVEGWIRAALARLLPADQKAAELYPRLARMAALQLDEGAITAPRMLALAIEGQKDTQSEPSAEPKSGTAQKPANDQARLLHTLERSGLLLHRRGERYQFRHPLYTAYFASLFLSTAGTETRQSRLDQPAWTQACAYLAMHSSVDDLVRRRMSGARDVLHSQVLDLARWMAYAPADAAWRGPVLRALSGWFSAPVQYPLLRERAAAALAGTRESSALVIFRQGARSTNPEVRRLACLGMGALGSSEAVRDLRSLLEDSEGAVALASAMALGAVGGEEALQAMLVGLTQGEETVRQAIAEALATLPDEGYPVLYEAIEDEDMLLRRAAVYGLRRIRASWAVIAIYRAFLEDDQWYVRSAAQQAFDEIQYGRPNGLVAPLQSPAGLDWLVLWAAHRGETVPAGAAGQQTLVRVLKEGDADERALAALTLGALGKTDSLKPLYSALRDRQDEVRAAAFRALGALQEHTAAPIPAPA